MTTIDVHIYAGILITVLVASLAGYGALLIVMWKSINQRLQSLGHEDRDIRGQIHSTLLEVQVYHRETMAAISQSNTLMAQVYSHYGPVARRRDPPASHDGKARADDQK